MSGHTDLIETVLTVRADGKVESLATDAIDLTKLGHVTMERWSNIEWVEELQIWEARVVATNELIAASRDRDLCIKVERAVYNQRVLNGITDENVGQTERLQWPPR